MYTVERERSLEDGNAVDLSKLFNALGKKVNATNL